MKKLLILLLPVFMLWSCTQEDSLMSPTSEQHTSNINLRSINDAISIAEMAATSDIPGARSTRTIKNRDAVKVVTSHNSRGGNDTLLYAVDFDDNQGFALIAAPRDVEPLLALVDEGSFNSSSTSENPGFQRALQAAKNYVSTSSTYIPVPFPDPRLPIEPISKLYYYDTIRPAAKKPYLVKTKWEQNWPAGQYFVNRICGCGPLAIAQMLNYFQLPKTIDYTFPECQLKNQSINWTEISKHIGGHVSARPTESEKNAHLAHCGANINGHTAISRLVKQIGVLSNADDRTYSDATSTNTPNDFATIRKLLSGKRFMEGTSGTALFNMLKTFYPAVAYVRGDGGYDANGQQMAGHAWVADGTWQVGMIIRLMTKTPITDLNGKTTYVYEEESRTGEIKDYIHFNWGWNGADNGYFLSNMFNTSKGYQYDDSSVSYHPNNDFNNRVQYLGVY